MEQYDYREWPGCWHGELTDIYEHLSLVMSTKEYQQYVAPPSFALKPNGGVEPDCWVFAGIGIVRHMEYKTVSKSQERQQLLEVNLRIQLFSHVVEEDWDLGADFWRL